MNLLRSSTVGLVIGLGIVACSNVRLGDQRFDQGGDTPQFTAPDADASDVDASASEAGPLSYCPSDQCPAGYTTCPNSEFLCDVNLQADRQNCGACGAACPVTSERETYECIDGKCVMQCSTSPPTLDCDGLPDNGCEAYAERNTSCGACGVICTDPTKPCLRQSIGNNDFKCGCPHGDYCLGECVDMTSDDFNCGACDNYCPRSGDGGSIPSSFHMYYGCANSECGHPKCKANWANCDGDFSNGCETSLLSATDCGACGTTCSAGQACKKDEGYAGSPPRCMCPDGQSYCPSEASENAGSCRDFASDRKNCGGCNIVCPVTNTSVGICVKGICQSECVTGLADCNGNEADGCEVNVASDPRNCGGCGIACSATAGQACVQGRCVVKPCDDTVDAGRGPQ
ncbi:hypothetical protein [Labilithrix luteola]|uniref:hypothetical protein n=1 Tax=Labilithrix luteola TaxID=1391654 RepID=UPI0011BA8E53|nr:hypothetical protein [Labilithrix luteola]